MQNSHTSIFSDPSAPRIRYSPTEQRQLRQRNTLQAPPQRHSAADLLSHGHTPKALPRQGETKAKEKENQKANRTNPNTTFQRRSGKRLTTQTRSSSQNKESRLPESNCIICKEQSDTSLRLPRHKNPGDPSLRRPDSEQD
jgi:hypothetical protein